MSRSPATVALIAAGLSCLCPAAVAWAATTIECPAALDTEATDANGVVWRVPGTSWLTEMTMSHTAADPTRQSIVCTFEISGQIEATVTGDCTVKAGDYADIEQDDESDGATTYCRPENGRTEECVVTCK